jgi:HlyD family secretion protein
MGFSVSPKRIVLIAVILAAGAAAAFGAWTAFLRPVTVEVAGVARDVPVQVFGLGTVEARVTSKVGFKVSGVLIDLRADVGDRVAKGTVLAQLDDREQKARVARAAAAVQQAQANLEKANASVQKALAGYNNAKRISERRQALVESKSASVETAETALAGQETALADVNLSKSDVHVAEAAIADAKAQQKQETATLDFHTLVAPYDAMVTARLKERGVALAAGEPVFTLIDPKTVWVLAFIDESKAGEVKVGEPAEIVLRSRPAERLKGSVARIEPESDRVNEERKIQIAFERIPPTFNLGEQAEVYITTVRLPRALLVPEAALIGVTKDRATVWTVEDGRLQQRQVTLGHRLLDGRYEITGGVPATAMVVAKLRGGLRAGRAASIAKEPQR